MTQSKELINKQLEKIKTSNYFNKSKISCDLLDYLVKTTLEEKNPKEYTIGIELFGEKYADENKQDSKIRVYIHNLRKKLTDYYSNEGSKDPIIFEVEKGKYKVRFIDKKDFQPQAKFNYKVAFYISAITIVILSAFYFVTNTDTSNPWKKLPVWQRFADNEKETLLVIGDYFVFSGMLPTGQMGIYRDFSINSEVEYEHLLDKQPELVQILSRSPLTYLSKMSVFCQNDIQQVFADLGVDIGVKLSSDIQPDDLKNYNIIYIGNYKNMGLFENIIKEIQFNFGITSQNRQFIFSSDPCATIYTPDNNELKQTDYALVISSEGYADNHYLFFLSTQDIGNISIVSQFTNPEYLKQFTADHLTFDEKDYFKALFKVEGINKTDLAFELIRVE